MKIKIILFLTAFIGKVFGFIRELILSYYYGASKISDSYIVAMTITTIVFVMFSEGLRTAYIPLYAKIKNKDENESILFTNELIIKSFLISTLIVIFGILFNTQFIRIFAPGFDHETMILTKEILNISLFAIFFTIIVAILQGFLQANNSFNVASLIGAPMNIVMIISIILSKTYGIVALGWGRFISSIVQVFFIIPYLFKFKYKFIYSLNNFNDDIKNIIKLAIPVAIGSAAIQINTIIDNSIASLIDVGGVSILNYANRLTIFIQAIFIVSLSTIIFSEISNLKAGNKNKQLIEKQIMSSLYNMTLIIIPIIIFILSYSKEIVDVVYNRGNFTDSDAMLTSATLFSYSIGILFYGYREIISKVFYSFQMNRIPMKNMIIGISFNVLFNLLLSKYMGIPGIALATSFSGLIMCILLVNDLKRIGIIINLKLLILYISKIIMISLFSIFPVIILTFYTNFSSILILIIGTIFYLIFILILGTLFKLDEFQNVTKKIIRRTIK